MSDVHQSLLARAWARLREARAEVEAYAANMDSSDQSAQYLAVLKRKVEAAERDVSCHEHALRGFEALTRKVAEENM